MSQKTSSETQQKESLTWISFTCDEQDVQSQHQKNKIRAFPDHFKIFFLFVDLMSLAFLFPRWHFYDYLAKIRLRSWDKSGSIRWAQLDSMPAALSNFFVLVKEIFLCTLLRDELTLDSNKCEAALKSKLCYSRTMVVAQLAEWLPPTPEIRKFESQHWQKFFCQLYNMEKTKMNKKWPG